MGCMRCGTQSAQANSGTCVARGSLQALAVARSVHRRGPDCKWRYAACEGDAPTCAVQRRARRAAPSAPVRKPRAESAQAQMAAHPLRKRACGC
eukprot:177787-Chlamydomonas_euryale.AAC.2